MHIDQTAGLTPSNFASARLRSREAISLFALIAATIVVYAQVASYPFVAFDDPIFVSGNRPVLEGLNWNGVQWAFESAHFSNWIPLTWLSFMLDMSVYRGWSGGFHITNVLFHLSSAVLIFAILKQATGYPFRALFVAGLFALHPLHVESVAWISERKDVLSIFFGLIAIYAYVRYGQHHGRRWYVASLCAFAFSLMAKQTLVTLPFLLLLLDGWPLGRFSRPADHADSDSVASAGIANGPRIGKLIVEKLPFLLLTGLFSVVAYWGQASGNSIASPEQFPVSVRCWNAVLSYGLYIRKALLPYDLAAFYPHPGASIDRVAVGLSLLFLMTVSIIAIWKARNYPFLFVGWFWFLGTLVPTIGIVQIGIQQLADRYAYFPLIGIYIAVAWAIPSIVQSVRAARLLPVIATGTLAAYACVTYVQVGTWQSGAALFQHCLSVTEDNAFARSVLADGLIDQGKVNEALAELHHSVQIAPTDPMAYFRFAFTLEMIQRHDEADELYQKAIALNEPWVGAHYRRAMTLIHLRRYREATDELLRSLELFEPNAAAHSHLARLLRAAKQYEQSIVHCERALELDDSLLICHHMIAHNLRDLGRFDQADDHLLIVLEADPTNEQAQSDLSQVLSMAGAN